MQASETSAGVTLAASGWMSVRLTTSVCEAPAVRCTGMTLWKARGTAGLAMATMQLTWAEVFPFRRRCAVMVTDDGPVGVTATTWAATGAVVG